MDLEIDVTKTLKDNALEIFIIMQSMNHDDQEIVTQFLNDHMNFIKRPHDKRRPSWKNFNIKLQQKHDAVLASWNRIVKSS